MELSRIFKNNSGFSLLELLIYMAILAGFLTVIVNIFFNVTSGSQKEEARAEVQQNLRLALGQIANELRSSSGAITINAPAAGSSGNVLNFTASGVTTEFSVSGGVLQRTRAAVTENITSSRVTVSISNPIFTRLDNSGARPTIQIILQISYNDNGRANYKFSETNQTTVSLR